MNERLYSEYWQYTTHNDSTQCNSIRVEYTPINHDDFNE